MALKIETFSNATGGSSFFKAAGHPLAARKAADLLRGLGEAGPVAFYDPFDLLAAFAEFHDLSRAAPAGLFVQDVTKIGAERLGMAARPITELKASGARTVFVAAFDAGRAVANIRHLLPDGAEVVTLDAMRLPDDMLSDRRTYLAAINWATNFALFRDRNGHHTRVVTANYWGGYGSAGQKLYHCLFDAAGKVLAEWTDELPPANGTVVIDSREVRERFRLGEFCGSLFVHVIGAAGHDVVKYALDTYGDEDRTLSCTHDANAWPADYYAGVPAPSDGERVLLWVQNSHPCPIPAGTVGLGLMGHGEVAHYGHGIPPFATVAIDVAELLPKARWPQQIEVSAGRHFVRPRYEVVAGTGRSRIAHANVERIDLVPDPKLPELAPLLGKGHILPAPVLPVARFRTTALPTPMSRSLAELPIRALLVDATGRPAAEHRFGNLKRADSVAIEVNDLLARAGTELPSGYGHLELIYDFEAGSHADGWLHGLFRYEDRLSGHAAETSFGAHIYNTVLTYRNEPQSYAGRPPGLTTRLFLRLGPSPLDTICHLVYPASTPWYPTSSTELILTRRDGTEIARRDITI
ncbi:MAG TPA: hypothetical protein VK943_08680, partial [Arenibaculum sp.]|nr:hypothetical protein [Arenibaculum sp.]